MGEQSPDLLDQGDAHGSLGLATTRQRHSIARVSRDDPVGDGRAEDRPHDHEPGLDRARRPSGRHHLHPRLDVGAADRLDGQVGERHRPAGQIGVGLGGGHPQLALRPVVVELLEGDLPGLRVDVGPG